jgi:hypothetical protein
MSGRPVSNVFRNVIPLEARFLMKGLSVAIAKIIGYAKGILIVSLWCTGGELFLMVSIT